MEISGWGGGGLKKGRFTWEGGLKRGYNHVGERGGFEGVVEGGFEGGGGWKGV